jgi:hypothetical protein
MDSQGHGMHSSKEFVQERIFPSSVGFGKIVTRNNLGQQKEKKRWQMKIKP